MRKMRRLVAVAIATVMVIGSSLSALADTTSGGTDGAGTNEGHVDQKLINVILPTVPEGSTPFAYTMDPERLIKATEAAMYAEGTVFPGEGDTGVYFLTAENTYANTSNTLQAINKSSCAITLTVKVKATQASNKDIALATSSTVASGANATPDLYLGLKVGDDTTVVSATEATVTKVLAGVPSNFEIAVETPEGGTKGYVYRQKATTTAWKAMNLSMEGAVSNLTVEEGTTAPTVNVTWAYAEAASDATASTDAVDYSDAPATVSVTIENKGDYTGESTTKAMAIGSAAVAPDAVDGYTFAGYYTDATLETAFEGNVTAETTTLYAKWTITPVASTIEETEYTMVSGEAVLVNLTYGVGGSKAADGVAEITYQNSQGEDKVLSTEYYSVEDAVLRFRPSYIQGIIDAGVTSRVFTIKFNDEDETTVDITLATE